MHKIVIYVKEGCSFCLNAKTLLDTKGIKYREIPVEIDSNRKEMEKLSGQQSVPQVFIHVGGADKLHELMSSDVVNSGKLDFLLKDENIS